MTSLTKICNHWTAGNYNPCKIDIDSYHYLIDNKGKIYLGTFKPEDNLNCYDGRYAKHCGGGNTGCIGISLCGMVGFDENKKRTKCPITASQLEALFCLNGYLALKYGIFINEKTVYTHYEFDKQKKAPQGKIDIIYIPCLPHLSKERIGNYIREKSEWYKKEIKKGNYKLIKKGDYYEFIRKS